MSATSRPPSTPPPPSVAGRRTTRSTDQAARAAELVASAKAFALPVQVRTAEGAEIVDADGNRYVDFRLAGGTAVLGHGHPSVVEAVRAVLADGTSAYPHTREAALADRLLAVRPGFERVRSFASTGEAQAAALELARGTTGRPTVVRVARGARDGRDLVGVASLDAGAVESALAARPGTVAAVVVELASAHDPSGIPTREALEAMRAAAAAAGATFVLDEGAATLRLPDPGVAADVRVLGATLGGGWPIGAVLVKKELAGALAEVEGAAAGGASLAAARAVLEEFASGQAGAMLDEVAARLDERLARVTARVPWVRLVRAGSLFRLVVDEPGSGEAAGAARRVLLQARLLDRGVLVPGFDEALAALATAHTAAHVDRLGEALEVECEKLARAEASAA